MEKGYISLHAPYINHLIQHNNFVYIVADYRGNNLLVYDVSDIENPKLVSEYKFGEYISSIRIEENYLFLIISNRKIRDTAILIFDIKNPGELKIINKINKNFLNINNEEYFSINDIYLKNNIGASDIFFCVDLKDITNPVIISTLNNMKTHYIKSLKDNKLLTMSDDIGIRDYNRQPHGRDSIDISIIDVSDPVNLKVKNISDKLDEDLNLINLKSKDNKGFPF